MNHAKTRLFALAAAHGASLLAVPPVLQAAESGQLEEIVVTARQREERIEDVPVSITAFTAAEIRSAGIERPQDFVALTTGVSAVQTAEAGDMQLNIRGINTGRDAETNFALVIDGVLQTNPNALNQELSGVTQIEVLKGPQGALYGRNALAGALILTTRKPGDEMDAEITAGYGSDNSYKGSVYLGGPLTDSVKGSIAAYTRKTDGQWKNLKNNCDDCVDRFEETGVSGRLLFEVFGGDIDVKAKYSQLDSGAINFNASIALADVAPFVGDAFYEDANKHNFRYINNVDPQNEQENINFSIKGDWDVGIGTLTSYLAYNDQTNYFLTDGTSDAFLLYALDATCQATNDANLTGSRATSHRSSPSRRASGSPITTLRATERRRRLPAAVRPVHLRRLPVPAARPGGPQPRGPPHLAGRPVAALGGWRLLRRHRPSRGRVAGLGSRAGLQGAPVRADQRPEPDRPAL